MIDGPHVTTVSLVPLSRVGDEGTYAEWLAGFVERHALQRIVSRSRLHTPADLPGYVAAIHGEPAALVTYWLNGDECEVVTLHSDVENAGAGTALLERVRAVADEVGCGRLCLITTNDNTHAIRFYQRRGFRIAAVRPGRIDEYRRTLKPELPTTGNDGIPIRDEIEFELLLGRARDGADILAETRSPSTGSG
jgi:GNAT superfamily N-acetyltransferase